MATPDKRKTRSCSAAGVSLTDIKQLLKETKDEIIQNIKHDLNAMKVEFETLKIKISDIESSVITIRSRYESVKSEIVNIYHKMNKTEE